MYKVLIVTFILVFVWLPKTVLALNVIYEHSSTTPLDNPHDLKLSPDGRYLMVSDVGNNRIAILDPESLELLGHFGSDHQSGTHDIDFDSDGLAYVADTYNNRVTIYRMDDLRASLVSEISDSIRGPEGVLIHPNGKVYVAGAWSGNVVVYQSGDNVGELKGLSSPHDLELAENGDIWLADAGNDRLLLLSPGLEIKKEISGEPYNFNGVRYLDVMKGGTLVAADKYNHSIKFISSDGRLLLQLGSGNPSKGVNIFTTPEGVEIRDNTVWISDSGNDRIVRYRIEY
jgi:DNA-binding beta-propeller fold protein YncE